MNDVRVLGYRLRESALVSFVASYADFTMQQLKDRSLSISHRHNTYTNWVLTLLLFATLHRPVKDFFCYFRQFHLEKGICIIEDKVTLESRRYGLAPICSLATTQLLQYLKYLEILAKRNLHRKETADLGHAILSILASPNSPELPLFFYIDESGRHVRSIEAEDLQKVWARYIDIPSNEHRRVMASALASRDVPAELIRIALRHEANLRLNFDFTGRWAPLEAVEFLNKEIDSILESWGFSTIPCPLAERSNAKSPIRSAQNPVYTGVFGPLQREADRRKRFNRDTKTVRVALSKSSSINILQKSVLGRADVEALIEIVKIAARNNDASVSGCIAILKRLLAFVRTSRDAKFLLRSHAPIPKIRGNIDPDLIDNGKALAGIRNTFLEYVTDTPWESAKPEKIAAATLVSGILFDEIWDVNVVECLSGQLISGCFRVDNYIYIDAYLKESRRESISRPDYRWHLGELSKALTFRLTNCEGSTDKEAVLFELDSILKQLIPSKLKSARLEHLCNIARDDAFIEMHPLERAYHDTSTGYTELSQIALVRLLTNTDGSACHGSYPTPLAATIKRKHHDSDDATPFQRNSSNAVLHNRINEIFHKIKNAPAIGKKRQRAPRLSTLKRELMALLNAEEWSPAGSALLKWLIDYGEYGTRRKRVPKVSTISTYKSMIAGPLLLHVGNVEISRLTTGSFEALYWAMLHHANPKNLKDYVGRMRDFHDFGVRALGFPNIDWAPFYAKIHLSKDAFRSEVADANIITYQEYQDALELIVKNPERAPLDLCQTAFVLIAEYRFGLRFDEAMGLMLHQVRFNQELSFIMLDVRTNVYIDGKSCSYTRNIPLLTSLTPLEKEIMKRVIHAAKSTWVSTNKSPLLMAREGTSRKLLDDNEISTRINACLREATGDPTVHSHHLRHTWVCAIELRFWEKQYGIEIEELNSIKQGCVFFDERLWGPNHSRPSIIEVYKITGHGDEYTLVSSYLHLGKLFCHFVKKSLEGKQYDAALANVLLISEAVLRKRRSRGGSNTKSIGQPYPLSEREIKRIPKINRSEIVGNEKTNEDKEEKLSVSPVRIDRILYDLALVQGKINELSSLHGVPPLVVEEIVKVGVNVEERTGYNRYKVFQSFVEDLSIQNNNLNIRSENTRLSLFLSQLGEQKGISRLWEDRTFLNFVDIWQRSFTPGKNYITVLDLASVDTIRYGLNALGCYRTEIEIITSSTCQHTVVEQAKKVADHFLQQKSFCPSHVLQSVESRAVGIRFRNLPKDIGTMGTFHRLLFIVSVFVGTEIIH